MKKAAQNTIQLRLQRSQAGMKIVQAGRAALRSELAPCLRFFGKNSEY